MSRVPSKPSGERGHRRRRDGEVTRAHIMEVAERLFAENGVDGTSLRHIMTTAGVSISLINYHFGTKEGLLRAIYAHRVRPLNERRMKLLEQAEAAGVPPRVEDLIHAFFEGALPEKTNARYKPDHFKRLLGRIGSETSDMARRMSREFFDDFQHHFIGLLRRALPELDDEDLYWRLHVLLCVAIHTPINPERIYQLSDGRCDPRDVETTMQHMVSILATGFRAPGVISRGKA